jgi:hypothetical protein
VRVYARENKVRVRNTLFLYVPLKGREKRIYKVLLCILQMYVGSLFKTGDRRSAKDAGAVPDRHGFIAAFEKQYAQVEVAACHLFFKANGMIWLMASHYDVSLM